MRNRISTALALILAILFLALALVTLPGQPAQAAPPAAGPNFTFIGRNVPITSAYTTGAFAVDAYDVGYIQYAIDQGTVTNTVTITMQYSVNGYEWATHTVLVSANSTDGATAITKTVDLAGYVRFQVGVVNTNTVTPTIVGLFK